MTGVRCGREEEVAVGVKVSKKSDGSLESGMEKEGTAGCAR